MKTLLLSLLAAFMLVLLVACNNAETSGTYLPSPEPTPTYTYEPTYPEYPEYPEYPYEPEPFTPPEPGTFVPVLLYHGVKPFPYYSAWENNSVILYLDTFYSHMRYLYDNNFNVITAAQFDAWYFDDEPLPPNPVMIQFDDGYLSDYYFVAPILRQFGFTAVNFVITAAIPSYCQTMDLNLRYMSHAQMERSRDVFEFASHSHNMHRGPETVERMSAEDVQHDFQTSLDIFRMCLPHWFAFPYGAYTEAAIDGLRAANVTVSWGVRNDYTFRDDDNMLLPRRGIVSGWGPSGYSIDYFSRFVRGEG